MGFPDAVLTGQGADGGLDVRAVGLVAQVKAHMSPVGRPDVQRIYGVGEAEHAQAVFFSLTSYTAQAIQWANSVGVPLFRFSLDGGAEPINAPAVAMFDAAERRTADRSAPTSRLKDKAFITRLKAYKRQYRLAAAIWFAGILAWAQISRVHYENDSCQSSTIQSCAHVAHYNSGTTMFILWGFLGAFVVSHLLVRRIPKVFNSPTISALWKRDALAKQLCLWLFGSLWAVLAIILCTALPPTETAIALSIQWLISCTMPLWISYKPLKLTGAL